MPTTVTSPPALRCIQDFIQLLEDTPLQGDPRPRQALRAWLVDLGGDEVAQRVLNAARERGANLHALLIVAFMQHSTPDWLDGPLAALHLGPIRLAQGRLRDIDEVLACAKTAEDALGRSSADVAELSAIKELLTELEQNVQANAGKVRTSYARDSEGKIVERKWIAEGAVVAAGNTQVSLTQLQPGLRRRRGAPGDPALDVLLVLVAGHLRATSGEYPLALAADVVGRGFKLPRGDRGGPADRLKALRVRASRCVDKRRHVDRARIIAGMLQVPFRWD
jgi:hypothetical protein